MTLRLPMVLALISVSIAGGVANAAEQQGPWIIVPGEGFKTRGASFPAAWKINTVTGETYYCTINPEAKGGIEPAVCVEAVNRRASTAAPSR